MEMKDLRKKLRTETKVCRERRQGGGKNKGGENILIG